MSLDQSVDRLFGPMNYEPATVEEFAGRARTEIDALRVENLQIRAELQDARTRLQASGRAAKGSRVRIFGTGNPREKHNPALTAKFEAAAVVVRAATSDAQRSADQIRTAAAAEAQSVRDEAAVHAAEVHESATAEAALILAKARAGSERLFREAHQRLTTLSTTDALRRLDAPVVLPIPGVMRADDDPQGDRALAGPPVPRTAPVVDLAGSAGVPLVRAARRRSRITEAAAPTPTDDDMVKQERTFAALWNAGHHEPGTDVEDFFRPLPDSKSGLF